MRKHAQDSQSDQVDAAFNRVLAAEARVRAQVEECRQQAAAVMAAAEERQRRIRSRADASMLRARRIADRGVELALAELRAAGAQTQPDEPSADTLSRLDRAIGVLLDEVLGRDTAEGQETGS